MDINTLKEKTLILTQTEPATDMMFNAWLQAGLHAAVIFKPQCRAIRAIRRLWADGIVPKASVWYGDWKNELERYDTVIVHADMRTRTVPQYIHKVKPTMRVIYWYWNMVNPNTLPKLTGDKTIECYSFDEDDCRRYSLKKNIQYYYEQLDTNETDIKYDVYFVGHDAGRKEKIDDIKQALSQQNITGRYDLVLDNAPNIPYDEVRRRVKSAKAILEVTRAGQSGSTLRALEALFLRKKLITTNENIVKEDFYNPNNIHIYGKDNVADLQRFIASPYDTSSDRFMATRTVDAWFMNFFKEDTRC